MDKIYIGDIPSNFCYAVWGNYYVDLYKSPTLSGNMERYRVYFYDSTFLYSHGYQNYSITNPSSAELVEVTNDFLYRRDFGTICSVSFIFIFCIILLCNIVTSVFKKGGIFSGLF